MSETDRDPRSRRGEASQLSLTFGAGAASPKRERAFHHRLPDDHTPPEVVRSILAACQEPPAPRGLYGRWLKGPLDRIGALFLLVFAAPLMAAIAVAIKLDSPGPVLLRQERVGRGGTVFQMLKFRSMIDGAEQASGPVWAQPGDPRVTALGRWLRAYRLDELPQLINVFRGEMSLVGPRPERPVFVRSLTQEIPRYSWRHSVRPGITGYAQVYYKYTANSHETSIKLLFDLEYIRTLSFWRDVRTLLRTIPVVVHKQGAV